MIGSITAKIFSELGSNSSLLPIAVKDVSHSLGLTTASYITGSNVEGKDRFIDEFGTQAIWIGGIPFYKKIIDKTIYKIAKHNPEIDVRLMKDVKDGKITVGSVLEKAIEHAPTKEIGETIKHAAEHVKTFKGLSMAKFIASTALTMASYAGLTHFRHQHTEKAIIKEIQKEENIKKANNEFMKKQTPLSFQAVQKTNSKKNQPSFGMNLSGLKDFMFNPVKNMMIVDGGITGQRLAESRNPQDFLGYVIKEGSFWAFMYFAGAKIQEHFEKTAAEKNNKSIDLNIKALSSKEIKEVMKDTKKFNNEIEAFNKIISSEKSQASNAQLYDFICKEENNNNIVVKMAKKSDIIKTYTEKKEIKSIMDLFKKGKKTEKVDTQHFIDLDQVKKVGEKLQKLQKQFLDSKEEIEPFFNKVLSLKKASIVKNIATCSAVLGLVVPGIMLAMRYINKDNKEFQVKKDIKAQLLKTTA